MKIFLALAKYNSSQFENYLTEAFSFLINFLLLEERDIGIAVLNELLVRDNEFSFSTDEDISISTQETIEKGRPDIKVSSPSKKLIYIEVKYDAAVDYDQIKRYSAALKKSNEPIRRLILLTRFAFDFNKQQEKPYKHIRWIEVYDCLDKLQAQDSVSKYLIDSFKYFMEVKKMSIQQVGREYVDGVYALNSLIDMIYAAIQRSSYKVTRSGGTKDNRGHCVDNNNLWCGVYYDDPLELIFQIVKKKNFNSKLVDNPSYPIDEDSESIWFVLKLDDIHFFSLDKDKQLEEITKFIKKSYDYAQQMRVKLR